MKVSSIIVMCLVVIGSLDGLRATPPQPQLILSNDEFNPVPVAVRGGAGETRVRILLEGHKACTTVGCLPAIFATNFVVPIGRTLLIDYVSVRSATGEAILFLKTGQTSHYLGALDPNPLLPGLGKEVRLYAAEDETVSVSGILGAPDDTELLIVITGRLIDSVDEETFDCRDQSCMP